MRRLRRMGLHQPASRHLAQSRHSPVVPGLDSPTIQRRWGPLDPPLWAPFAKEGAEVWDGHSAERKRMILKERPLRGIPNRCMVCSEYELGISEEHEGILLLEHDSSYVPGTPLQDVLGDIVLEVDLTANLSRCFSILGVAREVAAEGAAMRQPRHRGQPESQHVVTRRAGGARDETNAAGVALQPGVRDAAGHPIPSAAFVRRADCWLQRHPILLNKKARFLLRSGPGVRLYWCAHATSPGRPQTGERRR